MALPPVSASRPRALLCAAAIQGTLIVLLLLVVAVTAVQVRAVIVSAVQAELLAEALEEVEQPPVAPSEDELLRALGARLARDDQDLLDSEPGRRGR